jgi:CubicO group peptidase (beta-lactamase class C family)
VDKRISRRSLLKLGAASFAGAVSAADEQGPVVTSGDQDQQIAKTVLPRLLEESTVPGASLATIRGGQIAYRGAFGYANLDTRKVMDTNSIFQAASLTKPVFAYIVLRLCDDGYFDLDRPLVEFHPSFIASRDERAKRITAKHVLSHSSGLPLTHSPKWPEKLDFTPGEKFAYSGAAYLYLQRVIEHVRGTTLGEIYENYVSQPFALRNTTFTYPGSHAADVVTTYDWNGSPVQFRTPSPEALSTTTMYTTPESFACFMEKALFLEQTATSGLTAATKSAMLTPQIQLEPGLGWGLGWGLREMEGGNHFWHWGDNAGYMHFAVGCLETGNGLVIFTNGRHGLRLCAAAVAELFNEKERKTFDWIYKETERQYAKRLPKWPTTKRRRR